MNAPRPIRPGRSPGPGPRPPAARPPAPGHHSPAPAKASKGPWLWVAIGGGALLVIIAAVVMSGSKPQPPPEPPVVRKPDKIIKPPAPPPPPPAPAPVPVAAPPAPPPQAAPKDPIAEMKAEMAKKAARLRDEGAKKAADARKSVDEDLERERKEAETFEKRFADFKLDVKLTSNQVHKQALVVGFSSDDLKLKTSERDTVVLPWSMVATESIVAAANHVYRGGTAEDLLDHARFLVDRRQWKDAQTVLHKLKAVDDHQESLVEAYDEAAAPLISGKGMFQGSFKTMGATGLRLSYDFADPAQSDDFIGDRNDLKVEGGRMTLTAKEEHRWLLSDVDLEFRDEVDIEGKATVEGTLLVAFYGRRDAEPYTVGLGPSGTVLRLAKKELASNPKAVLKGEQKFRVTVRRRKVVVTIADKPALSFEDPEASGDTRGVILLGVAGGKAVLAPGLSFTGQVNPDYIRKKIGTLEMAARRSVSKELGEVAELNAKQMAEMALGATAEGISADDLAIEFIHPKDLPDYIEIKSALVGGGWDKDRHGGKELKEFLDAWLEKHPAFPSLWYLRGVLHLNRAELPEARDKFAKAIALFPDFYEAHLQTARTWQYAREFEKSLELARKALEIRPDYANALILAAQMRFAVDKKSGPDADRDLRAAEKLNADADEVLQLRRWVKMQTRGPRDLGCIHEFESSNYRIVTDISLERAKWYADQLEIVRTTYFDLFKRWHRGDDRPKPRIAIFNTREAFYTYSELCSTNRHENALGFFDPANNELVLFEDLDLNETLETLYHEAFHHFASAMLKYPPYWWNEGIAEYMSGVRIDPVKKAVKERARTLRGRLMGIQMALKADFYVTFEKIINYTPGEFYSLNIGLNYAQAWAMVHFFYEYQGGRHRPLIEKYFDELCSGKTQKEAFDATFAGKTEELEKEWIAFTKGLKAPATP